MSTVDFLWVILLAFPDGGGVWLQCAWWPIKSPQLTLRHRHARCDWSHDHLGWTIRTWRRVHWSDESRFSCCARLDMSRSSLGVVLRGLPARGRSVTFHVWRKHCISRTMMEWLTLKWSATLLLHHRHARFDWSHDHLGWTIRTRRQVH
jgi:hypothetical protein